jgi:hypothetical protein
MAKDSTTPKKEFEGLWMPNEIRNISRSVLDNLGKELLAHIYSFGEKGCYQSNETMSRIFMVSTRTISRKITAMKKANLLYVKSPKGYYRTLWVKNHPEVRAAVKLWYRDKQIPKKQFETGQDCPTDLDKTGEVTATNGVFPLGQNCPTTNTETEKETKIVDMPLPAGGQVSQLLEDRKDGVMRQVKQLKRNFGNGSRRSSKLTPVEFEQRKQAQLKTLFGA